MRWCLAFSGLSGGVAIMLGAFAAHGLSAILTADAIALVKLAAQYQLIHSVAMICVYVAYQTLGQVVWFKRAAWLMAAGIVFFSGSLYVLGIFAAPWAGPITPIGGICFIAAWVCILIAAIRHEA